jgi:hypothetical protein
VARTVHHTPWKQTTQNRHEQRYINLFGWTASYRRGFYGVRACNVIYDLRYPAVELDREDRRPIPQKIRREVSSYAYARAYRGRYVTYAANRDERSARTRDRQQLRLAAAVANAGGVDAVEDITITPIRHRHRAVWDSW